MNEVVIIEIPHDRLTEFLGLPPDARVVAVAQEMKDVAKRQFTALVLFGEGRLLDGSAIRRVPVADLPCLPQAAARPRLDSMGIAYES